MRVVHEHREVLALVHGLEAPGNVHTACQRIDQHIELAAERVHRGERAERVRDVEAPGHRQRDLRARRRRACAA